MRASPHLQLRPTTACYVKKQSIEGSRRKDLSGVSTQSQQGNEEMGAWRIYTELLLPWYGLHLTGQKNLQGEGFLFTWNEGRSMDKMISQTSFHLRHTMILCWSMDCPLPIKIHLNSSPANILGDSEEHGCSVCLLQLNVSKLCPGDAIRELTGMGNRLLFTE